jgi:hypothetical protein
MASCTSYLSGSTGGIAIPNDNAQISNQAQTTNRKLQPVMIAATVRSWRSVLVFVMQLILSFGFGYFCLVLKYLMVAAGKFADALEGHLTAAIRLLITR